MSVRKQKASYNTDHKSPITAKMAAEHQQLLLALLFLIVRRQDGETECGINITDKFFNCYCSASVLETMLDKSTPVLKTISK